MKRNSALDDLNRYVWHKHLGVLLKRENCGWHVPSLKQWFSTYELATDAIEKARKEFLALIKKQNPQI